MLDFRENLVRNVDRKFFTFNMVKKLELRSFEKDKKRFYFVPDQAAVFQDPWNPDYVRIYPSVTTIISEHADKTWLKEWKERVGESEAEKILVSACHRGQAIHEMAESYLMGEEYWRGHGTINIIDFNRIVPLLNENVSEIMGIELPMFNHRLKTAGRADLCCRWMGTHSIIDFKTARREKLAEQITDYFVQATTYAVMFSELYKIEIPQIVILLLVDHEQEPRVFTEKTADWLEKVNEIFIKNRLDISL